jgi:two-component system phosphate regulon sensor histidine kinase PhoR
MRKAASRVASGDFQARVFLKNRDELRELADSLNDMADHLQNLFGELSQRGEELGSIVSTIRDGLLVLDREGKILLSNSSFKKITGIDEVEGKYFWEIMRSPELDELVRAVAEHLTNQVREIDFRGRQYLCSGDYLASREGVVVLIHDITEMKGVEKVKKEFVVNLSHELRTPLTAIKGFLETLEGEVSEEGLRYLEVTRRHTDRLARIVDDLLLLSELEDRGAGLELETVDLRELIEGILPIFEEPSKEKNLSLQLRATSGGPIISGDRFKLEQVLINLIANAVKYTERGSVTINLYQQNSNAVVEVEDTGIGISEEHLPRVFERFYVVDKSRSKHVGGTGLGLSIVKHIVLLHNGSVDIESLPEQGTKVIVTLPQSPV